MQGQDHESLQVEQDCAPVEDCNSIEMHRMMVRTDQLLCIAVATNSQIYTKDSEAKPIAETIPHYTITISMKREWLGPW